MNNLSLWNNIITSPEYSALGQDSKDKLRTRFTDEYGAVPDDTAIPLWKEVISSPEYKRLSDNDKTLLENRFVEKYKPAPKPKGILYAAKSGFEHSATGLALRAASGSRTLPENYTPQGWGETAASTAVGLASDLPEMIGGAVTGGLAAGAAGLETGPGAVITAGMGAGAGTFAAPAVIAEASTQIIKYGEIKDYGKLAEVAIEQGGIGALTNFIGGKVLERILTPEARALYQTAIRAGDKKAIVSILNESGATRKIAQKVLPAAAEVATFTTGEAAKEGRLPTSQELATNAAAIVGLHVAGAVAGKILPSKISEEVKLKTLGRIKSSVGDADLEALKNNPGILKRSGLAPADIEAIQKERSAEKTNGILNANSADEAIGEFNKATEPQKETANDNQAQERVVPPVKQQEERREPISKSIDTVGANIEKGLNAAQNELSTRNLMNDMATSQEVAQEQENVKVRKNHFAGLKEQVRKNQVRKNQESLRANRTPGPVTKEVSKLRTQAFRTDAQKRAERIAGSREAFQNLTPENIKSVLPVMERQLSEGETGYRYKEPSSSNFDGGVTEGKYNGVKSSNPDWIKLKTLQEYDKRSGTNVAKTLNKNSFKRIINKVKEGIKLTPPQEDAWEYIKTAAEKVSKTDKTLSVAEDYNNIVKSGIKQTGPQEIIAGDLNKGDKVIVDVNGHPDIVEQKGVDKDGNIVLEDGTRETVDFFDKLKIYGKKEAPGKTPQVAAEEYNKASKANIVFDGEQKSGSKVWYQFTDKDLQSPSHGGTFLVKDLNKIGEEHQKQIDKFPKTPAKIDKNAPVAERLAAAIGNPEAATNAKLTSSNEEQQIKQIVNDSVKQKADLATQLHKAGHTEMAAKYRSDAEANGKKLKAADGIVTEKAVDEALKTKGTNEKEKQQTGQTEKTTEKTDAKGRQVDNNKPLRSKSKSGAGIPAAAARAEAHKFLGKAYQRLTDSSKLKFHEGGVPGEGRELKLGERTVGIYKDGVIHIDTSALNQGEVGRLLQHEGLHMLMREDPLFIKRRNKILSDFSALRDKNDAVTAAYEKVPSDTPVQYIDEEAAAYYLQDKANYKRPLHIRLLSAARAFLMRIGFNPGKISPDDLVALTRQGLRRFRVPENIETAPVLRSVQTAPTRSKEYLENLLSGKEPDIDKDIVSSLPDLKKIPRSAVPKADSARWESLLSQFDYISHKYKGAPRRIFEAQAERTERKVELENFILGKHVEGFGFVNRMRAFFKSDKTGYEWVKQYLIDRDKKGDFFTIKWNEKTNMWDVLDQEREVLQSLKNENAATNEMMFAEADYLEKHGISQDRVDAVVRFRGATNRGFDLMMSEMRGIIQKYKETGMEPPTVKIADESKRWAAVDNILSKKKGFPTKEAAEAWTKDHKWQDVTIKKQKDQEIIREISLEEALSRMGNLRGGYFPRIHQQGEFVLRAVKGNDRIRQSFDMYAMDNPIIDPDTGKPVKSVAREASRTVKRLFNKTTAHIPFIETLEKRARFLKAKGYDVTISRSNALPESVYNVADLIPSINALLSESLDRAKNDENFNPEQAALQVNNMLTSKLSELIKERGFLSSRLRRSDKYWSGFEEDPTRAVSQYATRTAGGIAKKEAAMKMVLALAGRDVSWKEWKSLHSKGDWTEYQDFVKGRMVDPKSQKNLYKESTSFIREMLRNPDQSDRIMGMMKSLAVLKFLAFRLSSASINGVNMVQAVPATISAHTGESFTSTMAAINKAALEYGRYRLGGADGLNRKIFNYIRQKNWDEEQFNHEVAKELKSGASNRMQKIMAWGMYMFGAVEKANRAMTIHAAYNEFLKSAKNIKIDPKTGIDANLMEKALHASNRAHGVYDPSTAPTITRGAYNPLKLTYTFQRFQHNYLLNMGEMISADQWKQVAWMLLSPAIIAGTGASLATPIVKEAAKVFGIGGDDPEEEFYKKFAETFGSDRFARQGIAGLFGVNFKGSIQMNNPFPTTMSELFGAPGAIFIDSWDGAKLIGKGQLQKGVEALLPTAFGSMSKAIREYHEGVSTGSYSPVYYGEAPLKADLADAVTRFLSFNPARLSGIREKQWHEHEVKKRYQDRRTEINSEWKQFYLLPPQQRTAAKFAELAKTVRSYNDDVIASGRIDLSPITRKSINMMLKRSFRPSKFERSRNVN